LNERLPELIATAASEVASVSSPITKFGLDLKLVMDKFQQEFNGSDEVLIVKINKALKWKWVSPSARLQMPSLDTNFTLSLILSTFRMSRSGRQT
jgi:hypothetical protein